MSIGLEFQELLNYHNRNLASRIEELHANTQDSVLKNSILIHGKKIMETLTDDNLAGVRDRLVPRLFTLMLVDIRKHPSYASMELVQSDPFHGIDVYGKPHDLAEEKYADKIFTFDHLSQVLGKEQPK